MGTGIDTQPLPGPCPLLRTGKRVAPVGPGFAARQIPFQIDMDRAVYVARSISFLAG